MELNMAMAGLLHRHTPTLSAVDPRGLPSRTVRYCRTALGEDAEARVERQAFDAAGRREAQWDARLWAMHEAGEPVPANQTATHSLAGAALATQSVDAGWRVALLGEAGQMLEAWDGRGSHVRTEYDDLLHPVTVYEQAVGEAEHCVERLAYGGPAEAASNRCGQLLRHDDPAGTRRWPSYGLRGQALAESRTFLKTLDTPHWPADEAGRNALLEPEVYTTVWTHDALGAVIQQSDARGHKLRQAYTVAGQLKESGLTLSGGAEQCLVHELAYNAIGQVEAQTAGNGVRSTASYDPVDGRLLRLGANRPDGAPLQALSYGYDPVGNVLRIEDGTVAPAYFANRRTDGVSTSAYDSLYQLIEATGRESAGVNNGPGLPGLIPLPGGGDPSLLTPYSERYAYDAAGNLTQLTHQGQQQWTRRLAIAPTSNRCLPWPQDTPEPNPSAGFDVNGNLQTLEGQPLAWDLRNQLRQATQLAREDGPADQERYGYDGGNRRVRKITVRQARAITHTAEVRYLPGLELRTDTATGEVLEVVTASAGRARVRALRWLAGRPQDIPNDQLRYQLDDHLGGAVLELDHTAAIMSQEGYYPYGGTAWRAARSATEAKYKVIRYSGQERDASGLLYYGFRYYAPWLQRWINPDPAGDVDGSNLYRFVRNNPITLMDNLGLAGVPSVSTRNAYTRMQQHGDAWQALKDGGPSVEAFQGLSRSNIKRVRQLVADHDPIEAHAGFQARLQSQAFHIVHFSNRNLMDTQGGVHLKSRQALRQENRLPAESRGNTPQLDVESFATDDFVFFSLGVGSDPQKTNSRFGGFRYHTGLDNLSEAGEFTHMELKDLAAVGERGNSSTVDKMQAFLKGPRGARRSDANLFMDNEKLREETPSDLFYMGAEMLEGLTLNVVADVALLSTEAQADLFAMSDDQMDLVVNSFYRPQVVVPREIRLSSDQVGFLHPEPRRAPHHPPVVKHFYV
ncbi:RHS repeat-associated core domain-containing protein [Pseudomonas brassicacearum]|uniref:RHS repeat protein n=1 Tax=Pseudomonas brassicacearum subsp. neoaurantiaca TaxID=494916 RepID=A0A7V8UAE5_9PSED|nr:RHS repeat protein [Pseudomonas brassicacearum]MBA1376250.1 RHS repeat protein [Pseudomonas brassicacearum subsp. neoaurantiaca]